MGLDVETPEPPELETNADVAEYDDVDVFDGGNYRREELQAFLREGAWAEAFDQWAAHTDVTEAEFRIVLELSLLSEFDFFWDDFADRVGYHAPGIPEDWKERSYHPDIDSWNAVSSINAGLTELGQIICDVLEADYIDWESEYEAPDELPDFEV